MRREDARISGAREPKSMKENMQQQSRDMRRTKQEQVMKLKKERVWKRSSAKSQVGPIELKARQKPEGKETQRLGPGSFQSIERCHSIFSGVLGASLEFPWQALV